MKRHLGPATAAVLGLAAAAATPDARAQSQTPLSTNLCGYTIGGNFAGCSVAYVWNGSNWVLVPTGAGTATSTPRQVVAQDPTTLAGSPPGTAGTPSPQVATVQGISGGAPLSTSLPSGGVNAGAYAPGSIASGAFASGAVASGAIVDLGSGPTPAANTTNAYLLSLTGALTAPGVGASTALGVQGVAGGAPVPVSAIPSTSPDRSGSTVSAIAGYTITAAGSGGTNGSSFTLGVSGGTCTVAPAGVFKVAGGALTSITYTTQGICTVAPTLSFTASTGLTGAAAVATLDNLITVMSSNAFRRSFYVFNPNQSVTCWGRFTTDPINAPAKANAPGSFPLPISGGFGMEMNPNINALSVECSAAGAAITAWEDQ